VAKGPPHPLAMPLAMPPAPSRGPSVVGLLPLLGGAVGRKATEGVAGPNPTPETKAPGEHALVITTVATDNEDDTVSIADESDDAFAMYETLTTTDEDLLHSIAQIQARRSESEHRLPAITPVTPVPVSDRKNQPKAKIAKTDRKWVESGMDGKGV
jgi:hypothetical protein